LSEIYRIVIRKDASESESLPREALRQRLRSVPRVLARDEDRHEFGEADEHGVMSVSLRGSTPDALSAIEVEIPRAWVMNSGPQVFALVFMLQGWTDWEVYDPQIEGTLQREAVLQGLVAMRQARMQEEGRRIPEPRLVDDAEPSESADGGLNPAYQPSSSRSIADVEDSNPAPRKRRWRFW